MAFRPSFPTSPTSSKGLIRKGSELPNSCLNPVHDELQIDTEKEVQNSAVSLESRLAQMEEKTAAALGSVIFDLAQLQTDVTTLMNAADRYIDGDQKAGQALERVAGLEVHQKSLSADCLEQKVRIQDLWAHRAQLKNDENIEPSVPGERHMNGDAAALQRVAALEVRQKASESDYLDLKSQIEDLRTNHTPLAEVENNDEADNSEPQLERRKTVQEIFKEDSHDHALYEFEESVWDAFMLQWFSPNLWDKLLMGFLYFLNMLLQMTLVYLIYQNMGKAQWVSEDDLLALLQWRIGIAHEAEHYDSQSNTTLATRVCQADGANIMAGSQTEIYSQIDTYKTVNAPFNGPMLCVCSICIWLMVVLQEIMDATNAVFAVLSIDASRSSTSGEWQGSGDEISFSISHASWAWRCCMLIVTTPRFVFAIILGFSGVIYLANSSSLGDLILNAMALGFVLDMDELMYTLVPDRIAWLLSITQPVRYEQAGVKWTYCRAPLMLFAIGPLMAITYVVELRPLYERLGKVQAILCGGTTNVFLVKDPATNIMAYATSSGSPWESLQLKELTQDCEYKTCSTLQASGVPDLPELQEMFAQLPRPTTQLSKNVHLSEATQLLRMTSLQGMEEQKCEDVDSSEPARAALQALIGVQHCRMIDARDHSGMCSKEQVRRFCPQTCSCHEVSWWYDRSGCPVTCAVVLTDRLHSYLMSQVLKDGKCSKDNLHEEISYDGGNLSFFSRFVQETLVQGGRLGADGTPTRDSIRRMTHLTKGLCQFTMKPLSFEHMLLREPDNGCGVMDFIIRVFDEPLCDAAGQFRRGHGNIAAFCPELCNSCPRASASAATNFDDLLMSDTTAMHDSFTSEVRCGFEWIFCGSLLHGTTKGGAVSHFQGEASEKIYTFWTEPDTYYTIRVSSYDLSFNVVVLDKSMELIEEQLFADTWATCEEGCTQELSNFYFMSPGLRYILVEGTFKPHEGDFTIELSSDNCPGSLGEITCNDVVNASTWGRTNGLGRSSPEAIFRFQAEVGVEYKFTSCSSDMDTVMELYDETLRSDPLVKYPDSTTQCGGKTHETITMKFDQPGTYNILVEGYDPETSFNFEAETAGEFQLTMYCAS